MTIGELLRQAREILGADKFFEGQLLLEKALEMPRALLLAYTDQEVEASKEKAALDFLNQRAAGRPLQYLLGTANFMGLDFQVAEGVLIPRFDTEILARRALEIIGEEKFTLADICTGSGAIAISISVSAPQTQVWASDLSPQALAVAQKNNENLGGRVSFLQGNLLEPFLAQKMLKKFDLIVSNPPYITTEEMAELPIDVKNEPTMALWGGDDGLFFYRKLAKDCPRLLKNGGSILLEVGYKQAQQVKKILEENDWQDVCFHKDFQGFQRVVEAKYIKM